MRQYPLDKLDVAMSTSKKLKEGSETNNETIRFQEGTIEFTADEWVFLKDTIKEIKEATLEEGVILHELKEILV